MGIYYEVVISVFSVLEKNIRIKVQGSIFPGVSVEVKWARSKTENKWIHFSYFNPWTTVVSNYSQIYFSHLYDSHLMTYKIVSYTLKAHLFFGKEIRQLKGLFRYAWRGGGGLWRFVTPIWNPTNEITRPKN